MIDIRCCDNLDLMAEISDNTIDLIYCDILYGTGRDFGDFKDLKQDRQEIEVHYISRIKEMYRILKRTGTIYLHMDHRISHWMRCILDDVFGYKNFRNEIIWRIGWISGFKTHSKTFVRNHDTILRYSKSNSFIFNKEYIQDLEGKNGITKKPIEDCWNCTKYDKLDSNMLKSFSPEKGYATQKPKVLLERIIKASSNESDLVADFYAGSFTTAKVCQDLNRNFIGCDIMEKAVEIGKSRIRKRQGIRSFF